MQIEIRQENRKLLGSVPSLFYQAWTVDNRPMLLGQENVHQTVRLVLGEIVKGEPFTKCEDPNDTLLNFFAIYERKNCLNGELNTIRAIGSYKKKYPDLDSPEAIHGRIFLRILTKNLIQNV